MSKRNWIEISSTIVILGAIGLIGPKMDERRDNAAKEAHQEFIGRNFSELLLAKKLNSCNPDPASKKEIDSTISLANGLIDQTLDANSPYNNTRIGSAKVLGKLAYAQAFNKVDSSIKADMDASKNQFMRQLRQQNVPNSKVNNKALGNKNQTVRAGLF